MYYYYHKGAIATVFPSASHIKLYELFRFYTKILLPSPKLDDLHDGVKYYLAL